MVKDIIKVCSHLQLSILRKLKILAQTQVYAPRTGTNERVPLRNSGVIKDICSGWRQPKCSWIKELITGTPLVWISGHKGTERRSAEISDCVDKAAGDIPRKNWSTVVAGPEWCKACTAFREHVPGHLESANGAVGPFGHRAAVLPATTKGQLICAIGDKPMLRDKRVT